MQELFNKYSMFRRLGMHASAETVLKQIKQLKGVL